VEPVSILALLALMDQIVLLAHHQLTEPKQDQINATATIHTLMMEPAINNAQVLIKLYQACSYPCGNC
jgi:hypothetical protein